MRSTHTSIAIALALLIPLHAGAIGILQIEDTVAGLDTTARIEGVAAGTHQLHVLLPSGDDGTVPVKVGTTGTTRIAVPGELLAEAGEYRAYVTGTSGRLTSEVSFNVIADSVDPQISQLETDTRSVVADGTSRATITVILRDQNGNVLPNRPVELVGSRLEDRINALQTTTDSSGRQQFAVTSTKAGTVFLRALDLLTSTTLDARIELEFTEHSTGGAPTGYSSDLSRYYGYSDPWFRAPTPYPMYAPTPWPTNPYVGQVAAAPAATGIDSFEVTANPRSPRAGQSFTLTIRALGADGKTAQDYVGTANIAAPDDSEAVLPGLTEEGQGQVKFIPKNLGMKVMPLSASFSTAGEHTLVIEDTTSVPGKTIRGELAVTVTGDDTASTRKIEFTSPTNGSTVDSPIVEIRGKGPRLRNLTITGGKEEVSGDTDDAGLFVINVVLDETQSEHTLKVTDDSTDPKQRYSGELTLAYVPAPVAPADTTPPSFSWTFSPESPVEGEEVTLTVRSEEPDVTVKFSIGDRDLSLTPDSAEPNTYTVLFTAPGSDAQEGTIVATDNAGNAESKTVNLSVQSRELPIVQNIVAEPRVGGVDLLWDPSTDDRVTSYIVYVGTDPQTFDFTLDTGKPTEGASVMGLESGLTYYFTVTAKADDKESAKSPVIMSAPLGLSLEATAGAGAVKLDWKFPGEAILVKGFTLEYGTDPNDLTEKRLLPEKLRSMVVGDLIPDVDYTFLLTPVSETGEPMPDMAAQITMKPQGIDHLHPGPSEPLPFNADDFPPPDLHSGAPDTSNSGLPPIVLWSAILVSAVSIILVSRRKRAHRVAVEFLEDVQSRYTQVETQV